MLNSFRLELVSLLRTHKLLRLFCILSVFGLLLHAIAAFFSEGFYDMDEHFQVMEFLSYKLGRTPVGHLAPEFLERDRSWVQPFFYESIVRVLRFFGMELPEVWAFFIRLFSALLGWVSLVLGGVAVLVWNARGDISERAARSALWMSTLLYCVPYLHARTSSENLGGSFFWMGLFLFVIFNPAPRSQAVRRAGLFECLLPGLFMGLGFTCRYQMAFMIVGFGLWWLLVQRAKWTQVLLAIFGFSLAIGFEVLVDARGYGEWVFAPWNYLDIALLKGKAAGTGVFPWWQYFAFLNGDVPLIGNTLAALVILGWLILPKNPLTWATVPFVLAHFVLAHKETRYLFPLISGVPLLVAASYERIRGVWLQFIYRYHSRPWVYSTRLATGMLVFVYAGLNFGGLAIASFKPAAVQPKLHSYLYQHAEEIGELKYLGRDPFELIGLQLDFYRPLQLRVSSGEPLSTLFQQVSERPLHDLWLYYIHFELPQDFGLLKENCHLEYSVFPNWLRKFLFLPGIRLYTNKGSIFRCQF